MVAVHVVRERSDFRLIDLTTRDELAGIVIFYMGGKGTNACLVNFELLSSVSVEDYVTLHSKTRRKAEHRRVAKGIRYSTPSTGLAQNPSAGQRLMLQVVHNSIQCYQKFVQNYRDMLEYSRTRGLTLILLVLFSSVCLHLKACPVSHNGIK